MKTLFIFLILLSGNLFAAECRLTVKLASTQDLETSFATETEEECKALLDKSAKNHFFGLIEERDLILNIDMSFKNGERETF